MISLEKDPLLNSFTPAFILGFLCYLLKGFYDDTVDVLYRIALRKEGYDRREWRRYREQVLGQEGQERKIERLMSIARWQMKEGLIEDSEETDILLFDEIKKRDAHYEQRSKNLKREEALYPPLEAEQVGNRSLLKAEVTASPFQLIFEERAKRA